MDWKTVREKASAIRPQYVIAITAIVLAVFDTAVKELSPVTLCLIAIALSPWFAKFIKSVEFPGGGKVELRELETATQKAADAGLLKNPSVQEEESPSYQIVYNDPTIALAALRIELERRLRELYRFNRSVSGHLPLNRMVSELQKSGTLSNEESAAIADLVPLLNRAIHAQDYDREASRWAMEIGPKILAGLDEKINVMRGIGMDQAPA